MKYLLLFLLAFPAYADDVASIYLGMPSQREDSTPLPVAEIGGARLYTETRDWDYPVASNPISADGTMVVEVVLAPGTYTMNATVYDTEGRESLFSDPFTVTAKARPGKPTKVKIQVKPQ